MTFEELDALGHETGGLHNLLSMRSILLDEQGRISLSMAITKDHLNPHGIAHGGAVFALCDSAAGAHAALNNRLPVTLEGSIHFYRPALPDTLLTAIAFERKKGKTVSVIMVEVRDDQGRHIADTTFSMFYKD